MKHIRALVVGMACVASTMASAQWQWIDKDGRKVFSDRPPPADVAEKNIRRQPGVRPTTTSTADPTPQAQPASPATPSISGKDKELEEKKKKAETAEAAKKKAEEEKRAAARAENCARARRAKTTLDSGVRMARTDANGEREIMDDAARASEAQRMQTIIDADCK